MKRSYKALVILGIGAVVAAAAFAATGFAAAEDSDLELVAAPFPYIEESGAGFTIAKLDNSGPSTVTQAVLEIELTSSPVVTITQFDAGCTPTTNAGSVVVSCPLPQVPAGGKESRLIRWNAPQVNGETELTISSRLAYKNDPNNDTTAKDVITTILNGKDGLNNVDSNCTDPSEETTADTAELLSTVDPQTSFLRYDADETLGFPCNWAVVGETGIDPDARCGSTSPCSTGFWFASLPDVLGSLTLRIYELPKGASLSKFVLREFADFPDDITHSSPVPLCVNGAPPATHPPFSCELPGTRAKLGTKGAIFQLKVQGTGRDPGYAG
jgi:hypothetical protein